MDISTRDAPLGFRSNEYHSSTRAHSDGIDSGMAGCFRSSITSRPFCVGGCPMNFAPTRLTNQGQLFSVIVAEWTPTNPLPDRINLLKASCWAEARTYPVAIRQPVMSTIARSLPET